MSAEKLNSKTLDWAESVREECWHIGRMLRNAAASCVRSPDESQFLDDFGHLIDALQEFGELPENTWSVGLHLALAPDLFGGHRIFRIALCDDGIVVNESRNRSNGGAVSVHEREFRYTPGEKPKRSGTLGGFAREWEDATKNGSRIVLALNDDPVCKLPDEESSSREHSLRNWSLRKIVTGLQSNSATVFGDDSQLRSAWDEICVQQQTEEILCWEVFEGTIRSEIQGLLDEMNAESILSLWLQTDEGMRWDEESDGPAVPDRSHVEEWLYSEVLGLAANYQNPRIIEFVNRPLD